MLDIDECSEGTDDCDDNALCTNSPGSFDCECNSGYDGTGQSCSGKEDLKYINSSQQFCPKSKNAVCAYIKHRRYFHLNIKFLVNHFHAKRLYGHKFDIVDTPFGRVLIIC